MFPNYLYIECFKRQTRFSFDKTEKSQSEVNTSKCESSAKELKKYFMH